MTNRSKKKKKKAPSVSTATTSPERLPIKLSKNKYKKSFGKAVPAVIQKTLSNYWKFIVGFGTALSIILTCIQLVDTRKTTKEKFKENSIDTGTIKTPYITFAGVPGPFVDEVTKASTGINVKVIPVRGIHVPDLINKKSITVTWGMAEITLTPNDLYKGINLLDTIVKGQGTAALYLGASYDNRLYIGTELRDLEDNNLLGRICFNHWLVYTNAVKDYNDTDTSFEVLDSKGYIIIQLEYSETTNTLNIQGYFRDTRGVIILINQKDKTLMGYVGYEGRPGWRDTARETLSIIKSIFPVATHRNR